MGRWLVCPERRLGEMSLCHFRWFRKDEQDFRRRRRPGHSKHLPLAGALFELKIKSAEQY